MVGWLVGWCCVFSLLNATQNNEVTRERGSVCMWTGCILPCAGAVGGQRKVDASICNSTHCSAGRSKQSRARKMVSMVTRLKVRKKPVSSGEECKTFGRKMQMHQNGWKKGCDDHRRPIPLYHPKNAAPYGVLSIILLYLGCFMNKFTSSHTMPLIHRHV